MNDNLNTATKRFTLHTQQAFLMFGLFAVFVFFLLYIAPYTRDDWAWGSAIGLERLGDLFKDYNGRYAGNIVEIILTRFRWLRALIETIVLCGLAYFMAPKGTHRNFFYVLSMCMLLLAPLAMMRQTLVYTAGFSNYVIPTLFVMGFIRYFEPMLSVDKKENLPFKGIHALPVGLATFLACLFMEHITLYLLCLSAAVILYSMIKYRKVLAVGTGFLLGNLAGAALMFSNGAYLKVLEGSDTYRSLGGSVPVTHSYLEEIGYILYAQNWFFNGILCLIVFLVLKKNKERFCGKPLFIAGRASAGMLLVLTVLTGAALFLDKVGGYGAVGAYFNHIAMLFVYIVLVVVSLTCLTLSLRQTGGKFLLFLLASGLVVNLPLLVVNPVSPRCFFPAFILLCVFSMECLNRLRRSERRIQNLRAVSVLLLLTFAILFSIYIPLYRADIERVEYIKDQITLGQTEITIQNLPGEDFLWVPTPQAGTKWEERYKLFYGIPEEVSLSNS